MTAVEPNPQSTIRNPQSGGEVVVSVRGLTKVFKDFWNRPKARAVDGVDFEVRKGEIFGLLGPNGSGKSTTIKLLLGLLNPTKGHIEVFGHSPRHVQTKARIGYLPELTYYYKFLTAEELLRFYAKIFGLTRAETDKRIASLLKLVELEHAAKRPIKSYSKGMQQRVGLAQSLINNPDLLILDEPTSGLDPLGRMKVREIIQRLKDEGKTVFFSSHELGEVEAICDRVAIVHQGELKTVGTVAEISAGAENLEKAFLKIVGYQPSLAS